ncbi:MAG: hypothetical protein RLZZ398_459 [Verrucomicrobiota bacterium]
MKMNWRVICRWAAVVAIFLAAPVYLAIKPEHYTPLVQVLLSLFLFLLAFWIGYTKEAAEAAKRANDRWLPQAESVIYRLMTLRTNVQGFSHATKSTCSSTCCDLPELNEPAMKAVKIKMKSDCEASSQRLDDIAHQLEDAIEDWRRFIIANCYGEECQRIWEALRAREERLKRAFCDRDKTSMSAISTASHTTNGTALP